MSLQQSPIELESLRGTVCVVTGSGNYGIGYGILEVAADYGMDLAVLDLHQSVCDVAARKLALAHSLVRVVGIKCDVTQPEDVAKAVRAVIEAFPGKRIGAVFANAGVAFPAAGILKTPIESLKATFSVNVIGMVNTLHAFVPELQKSKEPSVLCTTASIGGLMRCSPSLTDYCASKHAVVALTEAVSLELAKRSPQIRVCVCCPCLVGTGLVVTSETNKTAEPGKVVEPATDFGPALQVELFLTPYRHGQQVFDRIAAGEFYMICDNIRPYVDHDFTFDGAAQAKERISRIDQPDFARRIDNTAAFDPASKLSPLFREMARRQAVSTSKL